MEETELSGSNSVTIMSVAIYNNYPDASIFTIKKKPTSLFCHEYLKSFANPRVNCVLGQYVSAPCHPCQPQSTGSRNIEYFNDRPEELIVEPSSREHRRISLLCCIPDDPCWCCRKVGAAFKSAIGWLIRKCLCCRKSAGRKSAAKPLSHDEENEENRDGGAGDPAPGAPGSNLTPATDGAQATSTASSRMVGNNARPGQQVNAAKGDEAPIPASSTGPSIDFEPRAPTRLSVVAKEAAPSQMTNAISSKNTPKVRSSSHTSRDGQKPLGTTEPLRAPTRVRSEGHALAMNGRYREGARSDPEFTLRRSVTINQVKAAFEVARREVASSNGTPPRTSARNKIPSTGTNGFTHRQLRSVRFSFDDQPEPSEIFRHPSPDHRQTDNRSSPSSSSFDSQVVDDVLESMRGDSSIYDEPAFDFPLPPGRSYFPPANQVTAAPISSDTNRTDKGESPSSKIPIPVDQRGRMRVDYSPRTSPAPWSSPASNKKPVYSKSHSADNAAEGFSTTGNARYAAFHNKYLGDGPVSSSPTTETPTFTAKSVAPSQGIHDNSASKANKKIPSSQVIFKEDSQNYEQLYPSRPVSSYVADFEWLSESNARIQSPTSSSNGVSSDGYNLPNESSSFHRDANRNRVHRNFSLPSFPRAMKGPYHSY